MSKVVILKFVIFILITNIKIHNIYERNFVAEPAKVAAFKKKAGENKLTALALSGKKTTVTRTSPFTRIKNGIQNGFRKIKNL